MEPTELENAIDELEQRVDRLRALYEQYFLGIEKIEPLIPRKDVERRIWVLRREQVRNIRKRFRLQNIIQRYNTYQQYWMRITREIEAGTYRRHLVKAQKILENFTPLTTQARRRFRQLEAAADEQEHSAAARAARSDAPPQPDAAGPSGSPAAADERDEATRALDDLFGPSVTPPRPRPARVQREAARPQAAEPEPEDDDPFRRLSLELEAVGGVLQPSAVPVRQPGARPAAEPPLRSPGVPNGLPLRAPPPGQRPAGPPSNRSPATQPRVSGPLPPPPAPPPRASADEDERDPPTPRLGLGPPARVGAPPPPGPLPAAPRPPASLPARPLAPPPGGPRAPAPSSPARMPGRDPPGAPMRAGPVARQTLRDRPPDSQRTLNGLGPAAGSVPARPAVPVPSRPVPPGPGGLQSLRPPPKPKPSPRQPEPPRAPPPPPFSQPSGLAEERLREVQARLTEARRRTNDPTPVNAEGLRRSLESAQAKLRAQHGAHRSVDFEVVIRDGKAVVKPIVR